MIRKIEMSVAWSFYMHLRKCYLLHNMHFIKKIYIGETGRRLDDRFREHLRDVERNDKDASKSVARHFNIIILANSWRSVAFPYTRVTRKAVKI